VNQILNHQKKNSDVNERTETNEQLKSQNNDLMILCGNLFDILHKIPQSNIESFRKDIDKYSSLFEAVKMKSNFYIPFQIADLVLDPSNFIVEKTISDGGFGEVFKVQEKKTNFFYACKRLKNSCSNPDDQRFFLREIEIFAQMNHKAILGLKGFTLYDKIHDKNPSIYTEFMENGSLDDILVNEIKGVNVPKEWDNTRRMICLFGIAAGMHHLHLHQVIHRDLKPGNILIDQNYCPKITDFGLSKFYQVGSPMNQSMICGTPLWMAPELIEEKSFGPKVDVYAYAIIAYQILTKTTPFSNFSQKKLERYVASGSRPDISLVPPNFRELVTRCWDQDDNVRPSFEEILDYFTKKYLILDKVNDDYINYVRSLGFTDFDISLPSKRKIPKLEAKDDYKQGIELKKNGRLQEAAEKFKSAAKLNHKDAQANYGEMLLNGLGVKEDVVKAFKYLKKSAENESPKGMNIYACALIHGWGCEKNDAEAIKYFKKSAEKNYKWGCYNYAHRLESGNGIKADLPLALKYYKKALKYGIKDAQAKIDKISSEIDKCK